MYLPLFVYFLVYYTRILLISMQLFIIVTVLLVDFGVKLVFSWVKPYDAIYFSGNDIHYMINTIANCIRRLL